MTKRITSGLLVLMAAFAVVLSHVIPHHHHHGESFVCLADDLNAMEENCHHDHSSTDNSCCQLKFNLQTHFGDSRKENTHCGCGADHDFHAGHLFIPTFIMAFRDRVTTDEPIPFSLLYRPYSNLYLSALTEGHLGLRAPPIA